MANRLILTIRRVVPGAAAPSAVRRRIRLSSRADPHPGRLPVADRAPLDLVEHLVDRRLVLRPAAGAAQRLAVDAQGDLGDVRVGDAPVLLVGDSTDGVRPVVEDALDSAELALRVAPDPLRDLVRSCP